jgi:uncharacterized membrane protein (DUF373 family)
MSARRLSRNWTEIRADWAGLGAYERFETAVAYVLTCVIAAVIVVALARLIVDTVETLLLRAVNPLDHVVFQQVFGSIMTLLIALEFNHTLRYSLSGERGIIQTKVVILIALLALARKVIVADLYETGPAVVAAYGALALSLGLTYWLVRDGTRALPRAQMERSHERAGSGYADRG